MKNIKLSSTTQILFTKYGLPLFLCYVLLTILRLEQNAELLIFYGLMICCLFYIIKHVTLAMADEVIVTGHSVIFTKKYFRKPISVRVSFTDIRNINHHHMPFINDTRVTIDLINKTKFGKKISFFPKINGFNPFQSRHKSLAQFIANVYQFQTTCDVDPKAITQATLQKTTNPQTEILLSKTRHPFVRFLEKYALSAGFLLFFVLLFSAAMQDSQAELGVYIILAMLTLFVGWLIKILIFDPVDCVILLNQKLIIKKAKKTLHIDLANITCISYTHIGMPFLVKIYLSKKTDFGIKFSFNITTPSRLKDRLIFSVHTDLQTLLNRVYHAKLNSKNECQNS